MSDHVLLAEPGGSPKELVPATLVRHSVWLINGTPGLVNGCAAGDHVKVEDDSTFRVLERGGNIYDKGDNPLNWWQRSR